MTIRWPLVRRRRARWRVGVALCNDRPPKHCSPPRQYGEDSCCGICLHDADRWLTLGGARA
jgi:hypothetical protein